MDLAAPAAAVAALVATAAVATLIPCTYHGNGKLHARVFHANNKSFLDLK